MSRGIAASVVGRDPGPVWLCELQRPARSPPRSVCPMLQLGLQGDFPPFLHNLSPPREAREGLRGNLWSLGSSWPRFAWLNKSSSLEGWAGRCLRACVLPKARLLGVPARSTKCPSSILLGRGI